MKTLIALTIAGVFVASSTAISQAEDNPAIRHLVYNFTVGIQSTLTVHDSGIGAGGETTGTGVNDVRGGTSDEGTITVDVTQQSADGGLVVNVSEVAKNTRTAKPALCALYGNNLTVICDPNAKINDEEMSLLRVLGRDFVSGALDPHKHWRVDTTAQGYSEVNDFTISAANGAAMTIDEQRVGHLSGAGGFDLTTNGTILYDSQFTVARSMHELAVRRQNEGANDYRTTRTDSAFQLLSDSLAKAKP
ncbi:MAG: hypothetical protein ABR584_00395 [Candidatus Baltobacteraceae bacterium]